LFVPKGCGPSFSARQISGLTRVSAPGPLSLSQEQRYPVWPGRLAPVAQKIFRAIGQTSSQLFVACCKSSKAPGLMGGQQSRSQTRQLWTEDYRGRDQGRGAQMMIARFCRDYLDAI